ncbi:MAG TPA: HAMP domain-containing sensor histidine kinase, partial [Bacteroidales bacterium]
LLFFDIDCTLVFCNDDSFVPGLIGKKIGEHEISSEKKLLINKNRKVCTVPQTATVNIENVRYETALFTCENGENETSGYILIVRAQKENRNGEDHYFDDVSNLFLSNIAHEIRTPLNGIIGFAELLSKKDFPVGKIREYAQIIHSNGNYLFKLITDLLDLSRIEAGKLTLFKSQFSLNRLLYDLQLFFMLDMKNRNKSHISFKLSLELPDGSDFITADELRIKQVLINLIGNAIKFTEQGTITVGYKLATKDMLEFFVQDSGIGMPSSMTEKIFGRFVQANDKIAFTHGGTGLGLAIAKEFVELHGGKIWVESKEGCGATFYFTLPLFFPS